jgi:hypothetical protein
MPITQPDPETEGQSINKASYTRKFQYQKGGVKYSDFSMVENDKIYTMEALLKLSTRNNGGSLFRRSLPCLDCAGEKF